MKHPVNRESGFAMLVVFLMAAIIGITLYMEIPRVAFDSQRQREMLLIERGEQYKRAIQLFVKKNSRYPGRIEELESFNNQRYLRHKYKDPITGKDEWRLVHIGPGGVFTDSLVNKPKTDKKESTYQNNFIAEGPAIGSQLNTGQQAVNPALRRRASEGGTPTGIVLGPDGQPIQPQPPQPTAPWVGGAPGQQLPGQPIAGFPGQMPGQLPGQLPGQIPGQVPGQVPGQPTFPLIPGAPGQFPPGQPLPGSMPGVPGSPAAGMYRPGMQPQPGTAGSGGSSSTPYIGSTAPYIGTTPYIGAPATPTTPTGQVSGSGVRYPGMPGAPVNSQTGGVSPQPYSTAPGAYGSSPPFPQPGQTTGGQNDATRMIQQLLTTPRPGGIPANNSGMAGMNLGPGIAGIASLSENEGILIYNEKTKYNEWEFIYDPTKEKRVANPNAAVVGTPADRMGTPAGQGSSFGSGPQGSQPTGSSGFGQTPGPGGGTGTFNPSGSFGPRP